MMLTQALSRTVKDSDLPLAGSGLWAQHLLPCRPVGSTLGEWGGQGQQALMDTTPAALPARGEHAG